MTKQVCPECNGKVWDRVDVWEIPCPVCGGEREDAVSDLTLSARMEAFVREVLRDHHESRECVGDVCERCIEGRTILREIHGEED